MQPGEAPAGLDADGWLSADWPAPAGISAATSLRSVGDFGRSGSCATGHPLRERFAASMQVAPLTWLQQVHGTSVVELPSTEATPEADAVITTQEGLVCAVLSADCLPVLFCALDGSVIGAAHAGWRGLLAGVLERTVAAMRQRSSAPLMAWLGPAIGPAAFEVGSEVRAAFVSADRQATQAFEAGRADRWLADLYALARQRLELAGLAAQHIHGGGECTRSDPDRFFSYRGDAATSGRMVSFVLKQPAIVAGQRSSP